MNTQTPPKMLTINTEEGLVPKTKKYEPLPIHNEHLPALQSVSYAFNFQNPPCDPEELAARLLLTMRRYEGIGLAAVQCNIPLRVFALATDEVYFNPKILAVSPETVRDKEGCLSFPGLYLPITRPTSVTLEWQTSKGEVKQQTFSGLTARAILHEYEHLDGILFTSHVGNLTLQMAKKKKQKLMKKIKRIQEYKERYETPTQPKSIRIATPTAESVPLSGGIVISGERIES